MKYNDEVDSVFFVTARSPSPYLNASVISVSVKTSREIEPIFIYSFI